MRLRNRSVPVLPGVVGTARVDRRTVAALKRVQPGDVVVVDHLDLDGALAEALVRAGAAAVVNASAFISGRYPNRGPEVLARAGVALVDGAGPGVLDRVREGQTVRVDGGVVHVEDRPVASGRPLGLAEVRELMDQAREGLTTQLHGFTHNATEFLRRQPDLLLHGAGIPPLDLALAGRPVVVVTRDHDWEADLRAVRRFVAQQDPVLVGVDAGADVLLDAGLTPHLLVVGAEGLTGDSGGPAVSDRALRTVRTVLVHADPSGRVAGGDRLDRLGVRSQRIAAAGTSTDVALLVAHAQDAEVLISVGSHPGLDEFLDRQRGGLASTFLTRLKVGSRLVDARSVPALYSSRTPAWRLWLLLFVAVLALVGALLTTPVGAAWSAEGREQVEELWSQRPDWLAGAASDVRGWTSGLLS